MPEVSRAAISALLCMHAAIARVLWVGTHHTSTLKQLAHHDALPTAFQACQTERGQSTQSVGTRNATPRYDQSALPPARPRARTANGSDPPRRPRGNPAATFDSVRDTKYNLRASVLFHRPLLPMTRPAVVGPPIEPPPPCIFLLLTPESSSAGCKSALSFLVCLAHDFPYPVHAPALPLLRYIWPPNASWGRLYLTGSVRVASKRRERHEQATTGTR